MQRILTLINALCNGAGANESAFFVAVSMISGSETPGERNDTVEAGGIFDVLSERSL